MIKCFYAANKPNYGDMLTPMIIKWVSGHDTVHVKGIAEGKLLAIGSGMNRWLRKNDTVWGYGSRNTDKYGKILVPEGVRFLAVRGPMTRENVLKDNKNVIVPEVYGDPAMLMPLVYQTKQPIKYKLGVIPHYVDKESFKISDPQIKVIDVYDSPKKIIDEINQCEMIVSTSLHGTITSEVYGKSVVWLQVSDKIHGLHFKFNDYLIGTGREYTEPVKMMDTVITEKILAQILDKTLVQGTFDTEPLIKAWKMP